MSRRERSHVNYAFEAIGVPTTVRQAVRITRKGGTTVMVGVMPAGTNVELPGADIVLREKSLLGCKMRSNRFRFDIPATSSSTSVASSVWERP
jgi:S-(hydroxymethyl)glutathione dehydrogenase / alcohol dehydrogenase